MTRPLHPRVPAPPSSEPARPPFPLSPRVALAAGAAVALLAAVFAFAFKPAKMPAAEQVAAAHYSVQMAGFAYAPASITVNEGDTITWTNDDTAPHTVTTTSGPTQLSSPYLSKGQSWSHTFTVPGTYEYYCTVHPDMRAQVIVRAPAPATTAAAVPQAAHSQHSMPMSHAAAPTHAHSATTPAGPTSKSAAAPAGAAPSASNSASAAPQSQAQIQGQQVASTDGVTKLSPILLLGGLTAAIAVFCLLLVASRPAPATARPPATGNAPESTPESRRDDGDDYDS